MNRFLGQPVKIHLASLLMTSFSVECLPTTKNSGEAQQTKEPFKPMHLFAAPRRYSLGF